jgi:hypothetical protein
MITGSEEGWKAASDPKDSRHAEKQKDIKKLVGRYVEKQNEHKAAIEKNMEEDYFDAALTVAKKMQGDTQIGFSHIPQEKWDAMWRD